MITDGDNALQLRIDDISDQVNLTDEGYLELIGT